MDIWIPTQRTVVTARTEIRVPFSCRHCGFTSIARVVGLGSAATPATIAIGPAPEASEHERRTAREQALADGKELLALVPCPKCGRRGSDAWEAYTRATRIIQVAVAAMLLGLLYAMWDSENPAVVVVSAIPMVGVVFIVGYLRGVRAEVPRDRVTFLSPEELAALETKGKRAQKSRKAKARPRLSLPEPSHPAGDPRNDAGVYAHALLTLLATGPRPSATLRSGQSLPDLTDFAAGPDDVAWASTLDFSYERINADFVIGFLIGLAGYPSVEDPEIRTELHADMSTGEKVSFGLTVTAAGEGRVMSIERRGD